jgi:hypothetical protein
VSGCGCHNIQHASVSGSACEREIRDGSAKKGDLAISKNPPLANFLFEIWKSRPTAARSRNRVRRGVRERETDFCEVGKSALVRANFG